jgi:predicted nucleotidyltransferase
MTVGVPHWAGEVATALPYPLIFATVSGAHLYGFASVDSDLDVRAAHLLTTRNEYVLEQLLSPLVVATSPLRAELEAARDASRLPEHPDPAVVDALHDLVVRASLG